jgi:hypothetical protein
MSSYRVSVPSSQWRNSSSVIRLIAGSAIHELLG